MLHPKTVRRFFEYQDLIFTGQSISSLGKRRPVFITGQSISSLGKVPIEILPGNRHITWVSAVLLFTAEFQIEPLAPNAISYDTIA